MEVFDKHRHYYDSFVKTGEIVNLWPEVVNELLNEYRKTDPYYHLNRNCKICIVEFLKTIYQTKTN